MTPALTSNRNARYLAGRFWLRNKSYVRENHYCILQIPTWYFIKSSRRVGASSEPSVTSLKIEKKHSVSTRSIVLIHHQDQRLKGLTTPFAPCWRHEYIFELFFHQHVTVGSEAFGYQRRTVVNGWQMSVLTYAAWLVSSNSTLIPLV